MTDLEKVLANQKLANLFGRLDKCCDVIQDVVDVLDEYSDKTLDGDTLFKATKVYALRTKLEEAHTQAEEIRF